MAARPSSNTYLLISAGGALNWPRAGTAAAGIYSHGERGRRLCDLPLRHERFIMGFYCCAALAGCRFTFAVSIAVPCTDLCSRKC